MHLKVMIPSYARPFRPAAAMVALSVGACTASWNALVRYSDRPTSPDQPVEEAVYEAVLKSFGPYDSLVVNDSSCGGFRFLAAFTTIRRRQVPGYWADTLKREVTLALSDTALRASADTALISSAAKHLGIELVSPAGAESLDVTRRSRSPFSPIVPRVTISRPGFNHDSTMAVIEVSIVCGGLCGAGQTLFLARRPGFHWRIWNAELHWVS